MKFTFQVHKKQLKPKKILFLDRDGVVIKDTGYPHIKKDLAFIDGNIIKINKLKSKLGFDLCGFATNQSGVSRGFFNEDTFWSTHNYIISQCFKRRLKIDFTLVNFFKEMNYFRKPNGGMLIQAITFYEVDKINCMFIGDNETDRQAANNAGIKFSYIDKI